jgi:hypothetical protein
MGVSHSPSTTPTPAGKCGESAEWFGITFMPKTPLPRSYVAHYGLLALPPPGLTDTPHAQVSRLLRSRTRASSLATGFVLTSQNTQTPVGVSLLAMGPAASTYSLAEQPLSRAGSLLQGNGLGKKPPRLSRRGYVVTAQSMDTPPCGEQARSPQGLC